jgi:hypothetical protein
MPSPRRRLIVRIGAQHDPPGLRRSQLAGQRSVPADADSRLTPELATVPGAAAKALAVLASTKPTGSDAEVALTMLRNAAKATAMAKAADYKSTNATVVSLTKASTPKTPDATADETARQPSHRVSVTA